MTIDWWTLAIQTVNVVILVWLLGRFFWRPVAAMIERTRAGFAQEREAILTAAREAAEQAQAACLENATKEATSLEATAKAAIAKEKTEADKAWAERACRLAGEIRG